MASHSRLLFVCALAACAHVPGSERAPRTVAEAELAFAADAQTRTVNDAFVTAFAPDGIMFRPTPVNAQQALAERPIPPTALLRWTPTITETAAAADLAVSTGPSERGTRGAEPAGTGYFLSVWRASGGRWQVVFDAGIDAPIPAPVAQASSALTRRMLKPSPTRSDDIAQMRDDLMHSEQQLIEDYPNRMREQAASDVRVYRDGHAPTANIGAAIGLIREEGDVEWQPEAAFVSRSGDLGYVYGTARQDGTERGYVRIWRNQDGSWKVAYDLR